MPPASAAGLTTLEGELEVQIEDSDLGSRTHHFLRTSSGRIRLEMFGDGPGWLSGSRVRAHGRLKDTQTLELGSGGGGLEPMALASSNTFGEQSTLVVLVNFHDNSSIPYDWTHAANLTFNTTSAFFFENSHGAAWLAGQVAGWFTLPMSSSSCDTSRIASLADQAAADAGVNLNAYSRRVYAFPQIGACAWWGLGTVGGNPSRAWINGAYSLKVVAHEMGHNFGDYHSRSKSCASGACTTVEYGDEADVMGNPSSGHMNAYQKERLGWLNYRGMPSILSVTASGTYWIEAYAAAPDGTLPKALKLLKSVDGAGNRTWYYVELRRQTGFDAGVGPGVIVHTGSEASGREIYEIDLDPVTSASDWRLEPGQVFEDAALGLRISTLYIDGAGAMIDVAFTASPCSTNAPAVSASPSGTVSTAAGSSVSYSVSVTNLDGSTCAAADFTVGSSVPSGWTASASPAVLALAPGASGSAIVSIAPSASASGSSTIQIAATRASNPGASVSRTIDVTQVVSGPIQVDLAVARARGGYQQTASVRSDMGPVQGATVTFTVSNGSQIVWTSTATTNSSGAASAVFKAPKKSTGAAYTAAAVATSGGHTASASLQFTVR